ncbi:MAG: hypothetical protein Q4A71_02120 [Actinomycetaceae bacterium]|nr:hypothetical protein [Actinomycetaceae bacterium]
MDNHRNGFVLSFDTSLLWKRTKCGEIRVQYQVCGNGPYGVLQKLH